jgi:hypothetical protein
MLEAFELQKLARDIVEKRVPAVHLEQVQTLDTVSSEGEPALRITFVLAPDSADGISGEAALSILLDIHDSLARAGEDRFPLIQYATADDLEGDEEQDA